MKHILGVDIAKDKFDCCLLSQEQKLHHEFANTARGFKELMRWLARAGVPAPELFACMEATGLYGEALLGRLFDAGVAVAKVNPAQIKHYARSLLARNKTDRLDAWIIAQFARERQAQLRRWSPPAPEALRLRALTRLLSARKEQRAAEARRAKMVDACLRPHVRALLRAFAQRIAKIEAELETLIASSPAFKRKRDLLCSIPCVGPVTAPIVLAELPAGLTSARQAAAYAGLTPHREDSGQKIGRARLSKTGNPHLRQALYMPAVTGRRSNPRLKALAARLSQKGKAPKQVIGACMHLLLRLCCGVLASGQRFDPEWKKGPKTD